LSVIRVGAEEVRGGGGRIDRNCTNFNRGTEFPAARWQRGSASDIDREGSEKRVKKARTRRRFNFGGDGKNKMRTDARNRKETKKKKKKK